MNVCVNDLYTLRLEPPLFLSLPVLLVEYGFVTFGPLGWGLIRRSYFLGGVSETMEGSWNDSPALKHTPPEFL